jgi:16S rRNA (guanine527-N7)-methyltransferase
MTPAALLAAGVQELGLALSAAAQARLLDYVALLEKWNKVHNLTAVREPEMMVSQHLLDSLAVLPAVAARKTLLDVGSGGGLPGIPLALARADLAVTLLDSNHKKVAFLRQAKAELGLANVEVVCERVEAWRPADRFGAVVSRAFADLGEFAALAGHLVAPGGALLAMKGIYPYEELARLPADFRLHEVWPLKVPQLAAERHLVILQKAA